MIGAIIGDTVGSVYEFNNTRDYNFDILMANSQFTDDSIMSLAVAKWLLDDKQLTHEGLESYMVEMGKRFPHPMGSYGTSFSDWLFYPHSLKAFSEDHVCAYSNPETGRKSYGSCGNGSAMRASAAGWFSDNLEDTLTAAKISAEVTHDHEEGIKGAQAVAMAVFMARTGSTKDQIRDSIQKRFGYDLGRTWDSLHYTYRWDSTCQGTVPEALIAFLDSRDFEDAVRKAVSMGGDSDTVACITGAVAEAFYKDMPEYLVERVREQLPPDLWEIAVQMKSQVSECKNFKKM